MSLLVEILVAWIITLIVKVLDSFFNQPDAREPEPEWT